MVLQKQQGKQVNRAGLSEIFGVALPTVDQWARNGCPVVKRGGRGREWTFDTAVVARWLRDKAAEEAAGGAVADIEEWKRRKIAAEAQREELHLADAKAGCSFGAGGKDIGPRIRGSACQPAHYSRADRRPTTG
ncbi:terminase small subunit [Xylella fastidiosa]|uniref:terminase small subunit n=1 Tax=Xylella fastidiosa TaxID=2371 RepID=UPI0029227C07|nr:terminase small subunit [Xylella fastidiosa subsp. multiplex]